MTLVRRDVGYQYDDILEVMPVGMWLSAAKIARAIGKPIGTTRDRLHTACVDGKVEQSTVMARGSSTYVWRKR